MITLRDYVNWGIAHSDNVAKAEGVPLVMENCKLNKKMKELEVYGESVQDGTPSPDNPIEVESVGEPTVNLFDKDNIDNTRYLSVSLNEFATIELFKYRCTTYIEVKSNTTYIKSGDFGTSKAIGFFDADKNQIANIVSIDVDTPFTTPDNCCYIICNVGTDALPYDMCQIQEGSTATEYEPYGKYKVPVVVKGKNVLNIDKVGYVNASEYQKEGNSITIRGNVGGGATANSAGTLMFPHIYNAATDGIKVMSGKKYTFSFDYTLIERGAYSGRVAVLFQTQDSSVRHSLVGSLDEGIVGETIRIKATIEPQYTERLSMCIRLNNNYMTISNVQIEESSVATDYEPYIEPVTTNVYLNEPLRKIGDYADVLDYKAKEVVRIIDHITFDGSENLEKFASVSNPPHPYIYLVIGAQGTIINDICKCNQLLHQSNFSYTREGINTFRVLNSENGSARIVFRLYHNGELISEPDAVKLLLSQKYENDQPLIVYYGLGAPKKEPFDCELPTLTAKTSIVEINTALLPSNIKGKYIKR